MTRKDFVKLMGAVPLTGFTTNLNKLDEITQTFEGTEQLPVLFTSHGNPMEMLSDTSLFRVLKKQGEDIRAKFNVQAVLIISAHWNTRGTFVNVSEFPKTIYDFYGFPEAFYKVTYNAPGSPGLAKEIATLSDDIKTSTDWGFDHGSWPILRHLFPDENMPIVQMSMDYDKPATYHYAMAEKLKYLRKKGVLIIGSGSIVHNLQLAMPRFAEGNPEPFGWDLEFENWVLQRLEAGDFTSLVHYQKAKYGNLAVPTPDHYIPMIYALGVANSNEPIVSIHEKMLSGFSDRSFRIG